MILKSLRLLSFRAHAESRVTFAPKVNLIHGPNGAGKTNLLEAIHYLCLTKSFIASRDGYVLRQGCPYFEVEGTFEGERRPELRVRLVYVPGEGKRIFVNGAPMERLADIVGMLPVVVVSPEDQALTAEGPSARRKFLNNIMSQARPVYLDDVLKYKRAVKQRNALLSEVKKKPRSVDPSVMASWDAELVALGSRVVAARHRFLKEFDTYLMEAYALVEDVAEKPSIEYDTIVDLPDAVDEATVAELYRDELDRVARRERERGITLIGPHRDELVFRLNDLEVRRYASQGQHRTFGMALKLAKYFYLREQAGELPLLLLDDVFDTLDARRTRAFLDLLETDEVGQSLITAAQRALLDGVLSFETPGNQTVYVEDGKVHAESAAEM